MNIIIFFNFILHVLVHLWLAEIICRLEYMDDVMPASDINLLLQ